MRPRDLPTAICFKADSCSFGMCRKVNDFLSVASAMMPWEARQQSAKDGCSSQLCGSQPSCSLHEWKSGNS